jgi:adenylate kinase family enzyme
MSRSRSNDEAKSWRPPGGALNPRATAPPLPRPLRAAVVGITGSGKTTLACRLGVQFHLPHVELDGLYWGPHWTPRPREVFSDLTAEALSGEAWTTDGNYREVRTIVWGRANLLIWLDYSLPVCLWRLTKRIWRRALWQEQLWNGNRDTLWPHLFSRDSLYLWACQTYRLYRQQYSEAILRPEYGHLQVMRFRAPRAADQWLAGLRTETPG